MTLEQKHLDAGGSVAGDTLTMMGRHFQHDGLGWVEQGPAALGGSPSLEAAAAVDVNALLARGHRDGSIARGAAALAGAGSFDREDESGRLPCGRCHRCRQGFHDTCLAPVRGKALRDHEVEMADPRRRARAEAVAAELHRADALMAKVRNGTAQVVVGNVGSSRYTDR